MSLLEVGNLGFGYAGDPLIESCTFRLNAGERAALVAPNGAGKSTLLRLIAGELAPDRGSVTVERGRTVAFYRQSHELGRDGTVMDALLSGFGEVTEARHRLATASEAAASGEKADLDRLAQAMDRYQAVGADALEHRVASIASELGFGDGALSRPVQSLSGGERGRIELGAVLAKEADLLLLDEPTNHLDLETIDWLAQILRSTRASVLVVSHDRAFMDAVCPTTLELGHTKVRVYPLSFTDYQTARETDLEREQKVADEQASFVAKTEDFIRRNVAGQKTKQAQSRRRMLEKLDRVKGPEDVWARAEKFKLRFAECPRSGDITLEARGLCASRGGKPLFDGVDLLVRRGEKVGIVGPNGSGKTTLLGLLAGHGDTNDRGTVRRGSGLAEGYFDQHLGSLDPSLSAVDEIRRVRGDLTVEAVREYLARFRFVGDDPFRKVASFSGGERSRLALGKLLMEPRNLLFLDEPTNHLDIFAAEILEEAIAGFEGTVILVSHDRRFLENVTTRVVAFTPAGVEVFQAGFSDYETERARAKAADAARVKAASAAQRKPEPAKRAPAVEASKGRQGRSDGHESRRLVARDLEKKRRRAEQLESEVSRGEARLGELREALRSAAGTDWEKLHELSREEQALVKKVDVLVKEWERISEELVAAGPSVGESRREAAR
ncbi:MAG TPA: ABC-F family ATP-binding cassette domain-containing protein [Polyangiaceae bacterium]|nr:ABC-F family ATP-binding cassette domain-containing protein [Polyangiaceae bacterium]